MLGFVASKGEAVVCVDGLANAGGITGWEDGPKIEDVVGCWSC